MDDEAKVNSTFPINNTKKTIKQIKPNRQNPKQKPSLSLKPMSLGNGRKYVN